MNLTLFGFTFSDVALAAILAGVLGAVIGGLFQAAATVYGKRILPASEHARNLAQASAASAQLRVAAAEVESALSNRLEDEVGALRDLVETWRNEARALRKEVSDLRALRDEVPILRRELSEARAEIRLLHDWLSQHQVPRPPPLTDQESD